MRARILMVTTSPFIVSHHLREHLKALVLHYDVVLAVNTGERYPLRLEGIDCTLMPIDIAREIALVRDVRALFRLWRVMREGRFTVAHSIAPKAGLLTMIAAWCARVPNRVHTFQGEVWITRHGVLRLILKAADWLTARLATDSLVVGEEERRFLIQEGILRRDRSAVLANGSIAGIDTERFRPDPDARQRLRTSLQIDENAKVVLFLGRIARDKGVLDFAKAFREIAATRPDLHWIIAGPDEDGLMEEVAMVAGPVCGRLHFVGLVENPSEWLAAADLLCLPSYREGFPNVVLEAAATGMPSLGSRIYGIADAIVDGTTGLLHEPGNASDIAAKLGLLMDDVVLREKLARAARARVISDFESRDVVAAMVEFYSQRISGPDQHTRH